MPIFIENLSVEVLEKLIETSVKRALEENYSPTISPSQTEKLLTRKEACEILKISGPTLSYYTNAGTIPYHKVGSRVRYKRSEILHLESPVYGSDNFKK